MYTESECAGLCGQCISVEMVYLVMRRSRRDVDIS